MDGRGRVTQEHDSKDGGVRIASGTASELPRMPKPRDPDKGVEKKENDQNKRD
jgi:hypothetical protein